MELRWIRSAVFRRAARLALRLRARIPGRRLFRARLRAVFDAPYYLANNRDVAALSCAPLDHYLEHGWREGRNPCPTFDVLWYLRSNPDVAKAGVEPLSHYLRYGASKGCSPNARFDPRFYLSQFWNPFVVLETPLEHFQRIGAAKGLWTSTALGTNVDARLMTYGWGLSPALLSATRKTLAAHAPFDLALDRLEARLPALPYLPNLPQPADNAWRQVFQSIRIQPRRLILVGALDSAETEGFLGNVAAVSDGQDATLVLATDELRPSVGTGLPQGWEWMSLAEFESSGATGLREAVVTALLRSLQPQVVVAFATQAGVNVLRRHATPLRRHTRIVLVLPGPDPEAERAAIIIEAAETLRMADIVLMNAAGVSEPERLAHGLTKAEAARLLPLTQGARAESLAVALGATAGSTS